MKNQTNLPVSSIAVKVLIVGLIVGTFDITAALIKYYLTTGKDPVFIFKYIASGIFGSEALSSGIPIILIGLLLHYGIAISFTVFFCLLYNRLPIISKNKVLAGIFYGLFIWTIMNFLVVPLSNTPKGAFNLPHAIKELLILICMIGLPLPFLVSSFVFNKRTG
ncbi:hypothetical protein RYH73_10075 [Olivibacter sp. CPCC 100613]|uniref:hypothetical protein n=1 Tax=Olivibacter sp. CPCC 100613 TaxID=3079931 RepID=UPI002FF58E0E